MKLQKQTGFTIVELLVAIIVLGILASLSVFAYGAWRTSVARTEVTSDLVSLAGAMENARNFENTYPVFSLDSTFDSSGPEENQELFISSPGVVLTYYLGSSKDYCINGRSKTQPQVYYFIDSKHHDEAVFGTCATGEEDPSAPISVDAGSDVELSARLSAQGDVTCALSVDYEAYCWGANGNGQTGIGSKTTPVTTPTAVVQGARPDMVAKSVSAGYQHSCVIGSNDRAYCFGERLQFGSSSGALGDNNSSPYPTYLASPSAVTDAGALAGGKARQVSSWGIYTCAIGMDDFVYCWGMANTNKQLGTGAGQSYVPVRIEENGVLTGKSIRQLESATWHSCVIASDGWVYCWGAFGRIGVPKTVLFGSSLATRVDQGDVPSGARFIQIDAVGTRTCGVSSQHRLYCWGQISGNDLADHLGLLLSGDDGHLSVPTAINLAEIPIGGKVRQVALGEDHVCVIGMKGKVYCAGERGAAGALGDGQTGGESDTAVEVERGEMPSNATARYIQAGSHHTCIVASNDKIYCWGSNSNGQLGNGSTVSSAVPIEVVSLP